MMKKVLTISGSQRAQSANVRLLQALPKLFPNIEFRYYDGLGQLPLFTADQDRHPWPEAVLQWRGAVEIVDAVIVSSPEYIYNLPALLKNALEWLASSGQLLYKPVLPITFCPHIPRGEKAMQSLLWSLKALEARIVAQLPLYQNETVFDEDQQLVNNESSELLRTAIEMLVNA